MNPSLPISRLVDVSVSLSTTAAQAQNLNSLLILGSSPVINVVERIRSYSTLAEVADDFGTTAPEYLAAVLWFEQAPQPNQLYIGRWAEAATSAVLVSSAFSAAQQTALITTLAAITTGSFKISINGTPENILALDFTGVTNLNAAAAVIQTALAASVAGSTCVWDPNSGTFVITAGGAAGATSTLSFASAEGTGIDISGTLGLTATSNGAYIAGGIAAETALAAVTLFDEEFGQQWYAVTVLGIENADAVNVAAYVEATTTQHYFGATTQEAGVLSSNDTTDLAYLLMQGNYSKSAVQYSSSNQYAVVSLLARILTTNYTGNNTTITLMYKQEPGIVAETLTTAQIEALEAKNCNVFVNYNNNTAIIEPGVSSSGDFIDTVMGAAALAITVQTAVYNALYTSTTKIPQTDAGMHILATVISNVCTQFVNNGLLAPGVWNSGGFGTLNEGDFMSKGFYVYAPPIATQTQAQRASRLSVPFQVAAKLAGAVHKANVAITVNA